jgi:rhodanese-related sulfurtransferase
MQDKLSFGDLVDDAKTRIREISPDEVMSMLTGKQPFHFLDVREDHEWMAGYASGARHLGRGIIERDIEKMVPEKDALIVLYCGGGFRSALAADNLQKMGYGNVLSMAGGIRLWREKGFPQE